jgi:hypothetical protein
MWRNTVKCWLALGLLSISCLPVQPQVAQVPVRIIVTETQEKAEHIPGELKAGADFAPVAKAESTDPAAAEAGSLGVVTPDGLRTELRNAMQGLNPGQFSGSCAFHPATRFSKSISRMVLTSGYDSCDHPHYFHNNGDGTFADWSDRSGCPKCQRVRTFFRPTSTTTHTAAIGRESGGESGRQRVHDRATRGFDPERYGRQLRRQIEDRSQAAILVACVICAWTDLRAEEWRVAMSGQLNSHIGPPSRL